MDNKITQLAKVFSSIHNILRRKYKVKSTDIILASYPRSGNTWMRVILAEILYGTSGDSLEDLQCYIPDIHAPIFSRGLINADIHVIKSHRPKRTDTDQPLGTKNIYLIRDPRDVAFSYFQYVVNLRNYDGNFDQFCVDWLNGRIWPCSWREHVTSWTSEGIPQDQSQFILKYEDLISSFREQINSIASFLSVNLKSQDFERIAGNASLESMRAKEIRGVRRKEYHKHYRLIRKSPDGSWKDRLSKEHYAIFNDYIGELMQRFGYI